MKKFKLIKLLFAFIAVATLMSCSGDGDSTDDDVVAEEGVFLATVDGAQFTSSGINVGSGFVDGTFFIGAQDPTTNEQITLTVQNASEGTFDIGFVTTTPLGVAAYNIDGGNAYLSITEGGTGQITISKIDIENQLSSGTFEFVATREVFDSSGNIVTETVTVTSGSFTNIFMSLEIPGDGVSSLSAKVDGVDFNPDSVIAIETSFLGINIINITANDNDTNQNLSLTLPADIVVGTYEMSPLLLSGDEIIGTYNPNLGDGTTLPFGSEPGTLTITGFDTSTGTIEGTFEFTAIDPFFIDPTTFEITNGVFSVVLQ